MKKIPRYMKSAVIALLMGIVLVHCSSSSTLTVTANAGDDYDVLVGTTATLNGLASVNASTATWTFTSKPTDSVAVIKKSTTLEATFVPDVAGNYIVKLSVNNAVSTDSITITAKNIVATISVPSASAITTRKRFGVTEYVMNFEKEGGLLSAENSGVASDHSIATYVWEVAAGPNVSTADARSSSLSFSTRTIETLLNRADEFKWQVMPIARDDTKTIIKLTITDDAGNADSEVFALIMRDNDAEIRTQAGITNIATGAKVYLSGPSRVPASSTGVVTDWSWTLSPPTGSSAKFSKSGTTSSAIQFPSFTPDIAGVYTVTYTSTSAGSDGTLSMSASSWVGVGTVGGTTAVAPQCANCHDGSVQADQQTGYAATLHASLFENNMTAYAGQSPEPHLWERHTVGYNTDASNGGFDDLASANSFIFPSNGLTWSEFLASDPEVAPLANVQCENCHGPGGKHNGNPLRITYSYAQSGTCGQCHLEHSEWENSLHNSNGDAHGRAIYQTYWTGNAGCVRCHTAEGFVTYIEGGHDALQANQLSDAFAGVTCAGCHDPHDATNPSQLRLYGNVTMAVDGTTVDAGKAAVCYTCHDGFYEYQENDCTSNAGICTTIEQTAVEYLRQVHYNPQAPVLEGKGAITDFNRDGTADITLNKNSFHSGASFILSEVTGDSTLRSTNDKCVTCHMATGPASTEDHYKGLGGHAFKLRTGINLGFIEGEEVEDQGIEDFDPDADVMISACTSCHLDITTETQFNRPARADYDGDGTIEGIQDEVYGLLLAVSAKILSLDTTNINQTSGSATDANGDIVPATIGFKGASTALQTTSFNATTDTLKNAVWNHNLIVRDGSFGIHNAAFTIQVLQKTYTASGGNSFATDYPNATVR